MKHIYATPMALFFFAQVAFATQPECFAKLMLDAKSKNQILNVQISPSYFEDIHSDSTSTCMDFKPGQVFQVIDQQTIQGVKMVQVYGPISSLSKWIPADQLNRVDAKQVALKRSYFKNNPTLFQRSCFKVDRDHVYQATRINDGNVEVRDPSTHMVTWFASERLVFEDPRLVAKCPDYDERRPVYPYSNKNSSGN